MKVRILGKEEVRRVIDMERVIRGVEGVYRLKAEGQTAVWPLVSYDFEDAQGAMDIRSGYVKGYELHGMKMLNNFPHNREKELPPFNGMLMVFDSNTGIPLGVMDAAYITCMRTGAAGALGAKYLARKDSKDLLVLGAGKQAAYQIAATLILLPGIKTVRIADPLSQANAEEFTEGIRDRLEAEFGLKVKAGTEFLSVTSLPEAVEESDIIITITPSREPVIRSEWVKPGTHFSCIGADMEGKEEIDPELFHGARVFADDKPQCMRVGEMEIPIQKGVIQEADICGELGQLIEGSLPGRQSDEEITIFDATGLALLDLVTGKLVLDLAGEKNLGVEIEM